MRQQWAIESEQHLAEVAAQLAKMWQGQSIKVFLEGDLGAGKTTFMRHYLRAQGYEGRVVSPTYTLVEQYPLANGLVVHADLYRIQADEVYWLDLESLDNEGVQFWIEWASVALDSLWVPDFTLLLEQDPQNENSRLMQLHSGYFANPQSDVN